MLLYWISGGIKAEAELVSTESGVRWNVVLLPINSSRDFFPMPRDYFANTVERCAEFAVTGNWGGSWYALVRRKFDCQ